MGLALKSVRYFIIFLVIATYLVFVVVVNQDKQQRIDILLNQQINYLHENYKVTMDFFKTISENSYKMLFNRPNVLELFYQAKHTQDKHLKAKLRQKLYKILRPHFDHLKKSGVNIMLFSFPNNQAFLRVHKPSKFDDDLSKVRYGITYTNKTEKTVRGFEQGKISHAFRNIKPLYFKGEFLGSVDLSFSSEVMQEKMRAIHGSDTHFILNKHVFDTKIWKAQNQVHYEPSIEHDDFLFSIPKNRTFLPTKLQITQELKEEIDKGIRTSEPFSLYDRVNDSVYIISFSPIHNIKEHKTVAYLVSYVKSDYLHELLDQYFLWYLSFLIGLILVAMLFYRNVKDRFLLRDRVEEEVLKNREKDVLVTQQARHAQMGEMISMIAHQWRQPLASISATVTSMIMEAQLKGNDEDKRLERIADYTQHLSQTINDFREFFKEDKGLCEMRLEQIVDESLAMVEAILESEGVKVVKEYSCNEILLTYSNELKQVVLNLIKNAQDIFREDKISDPKIMIKTFKDAEYCYITFEDNAGGIPEDIMGKIFDPYFTTKGSLNGSGLGLYMSKKIVQEHCHGALEVENRGEGACFTMKLKRTQS